MTEPGMPLEGKLRLHLDVPCHRDCIMMYTVVIIKAKHIEYTCTYHGLTTNTPPATHLGLFPMLLMSLLQKAIPGTHSPTATEQYDDTLTKSNGTTHTLQDMIDSVS